MARCIQLVAKSIINRRRYHSIHKFCTNKELSLRDLEVMDRNDDGIVAWSDFLEFMLLAMKRVDQNMLDELRKQFDRLDVDKSGTLDKQDLIELAKRELQSPRRKLQLALYKKNLMAKCLNANPEKVGGLTVALEINPPSLPDLPPIT
jgi:Ca2+-binding EF-hand superfamily protein